MGISIGFRNSRKGFTLIELLIVVAIIGILSTIATVNYLNATVRAKSVHAKAEVTVLRNAMELYRIDHNKFPPDWNDPGATFPGADGAPPNIAERQPGFGFMRYLSWRAQSVLTTPVDYLTSLPDEPFYPGYSYTYDGRAFDGVIKNYLFSSMGPDRTVGDWYIDFEIYYDPTNGTVSDGDIWVTTNLIREYMFGI
jgi:general secretion pathway protein G